MRDTLRFVLNRRSLPFILGGQLLVLAFLLFGAGSLMPLPDELVDRLPGATYFVAVVTTAVGGIVAQGDIESYRPAERPVRAYLTKLLTLAILAPLLTLPIVAGLIVGAWFTIGAQTVTGHASEIAARTAWGLALTVAAAWTGATLALVLGHWVAAAGLVAALAFFEFMEISDGYGNPTMNLLGHWMPRINYDAVVDHGTRYEIYVRGGGFRGTGQAERSFEQGLAYFAWTVALTLLAGAVAALIRNRSARRKPS